MNSKTKKTNVIFYRTRVRKYQDDIINNIGNDYFKTISLLVNKKTNAIFKRIILVRRYSKYSIGKIYSKIISLWVNKKHYSGCFRYIKNISRYIVNTSGLSLLIFLISVNTAFASSNSQSSYCRSRRLGWHFYCEEPKIKKQKTTKEKKEIKPQVQKMTPQQELKDIQEELEKRKALAILYPTENNIKNYIIFQRQQLDRSSIFAQQWQRTVWSNPELDYSLVRPTNAVGSRAWTDDRIKKEEAVLKELELHKRYGLFFIYKSTCPYCHSYGPILKNFAEQYNLSIVSITLDGIKLKDFPDSLIENGQLAKLGIENVTVPATLLYDNQEKKIIPIGYGTITQDELTSRILKLLKIEVGNDL